VSDRDVVHQHGVPDRAAVAELTDVEAGEVDAAAGRGDAVEVAAVRAARADRSGDPVALLDQVGDVAVDVREAVAPGHHGP
jgi:hypothetical protein